jgi:hypothetical protein
MAYPPSAPAGYQNINAWCQQHYSNQISETVSEDAKKRHLKSIVPNIRSYDALDRALVSGRTAIGFGIDWNSGWAGLRGVDKCSTFPSGRFFGGHALMFFGWRTFGGERWPLMHNSHEGWGQKRRVAIAPRTVDWMLKNSRYGAVAATDVELNEPIPEARDWDWVTADNFRSKPVNPFE